MNNALVRSVFFFTIVLSFSNQAHSACGTPSPLVKAGKAPYDFYTPNALKPKEFRQLSRFISELEGRYTGTATTTKCFDKPGGGYRTEVDHYQAKAEFNPTDGTGISASLDMENKGKAFGGLLSYNISEVMLTQPDKVSEITTSVSKLTKYELTINFRQVIKLKNGATRPMEQTLHIHKSGSNVDLSLTEFFNGLSTDVKKWSLQRKK